METTTNNETGNETVADNGKRHRSHRGSRSQYKGVCVRKDLRLAIYLRDDFRCIYCLSDLRGVHPTDITLDHLTPVSDGGGNTPNNLLTACRHCNCSRGDQPVERFTGPETKSHIDRNTKRSIKPFRLMAKAIILGETEDPRGNLPMDE